MTFIYHYIVHSASVLPLMSSVFKLYVVQGWDFNLFMFVPTIKEA